jgi:ZIP family zinc transporter
MEAAGRSERRGPGSLPAWALGAIPLALIAAAVAAFALLGGPGLGDRPGPPIEELGVERTVLRPGEIELTLRNTGPDDVTVAQASVNDAYVNFESDPNGAIGHLDRQQVKLDYDWQEGSPYAITLLTSTGATITHEIPVALGMGFMPFLRRVRERWVRLLLAFTVGLLAFLVLDGSLEGLEAGNQSASAFGGAELLFLGAGIAYLALTALDRWLADRVERSRRAEASGYRLALMIATGIGLHNLGEGLAIGSAYAVGSLALGAFLVIGFAIHNTTEGLAIVAPLTRDERPGLGRVGLLGVIAGAPAILGAVIGASAYNQELATFLLGIGVGAIVQVIVQLTPSIRDREGRALHPLSIAGIVAGVAVLYLTSLLITV